MLSYWLEQNKEAKYEVHVYISLPSDHKTDTQLCTISKEGQQVHCLSKDHHSRNPFYSVPGL